MSSAFHAAVMRLLLLVLPVLAWLPACVMAAEPGKDHPLVGRYEGAVLDGYPPPFEDLPGVPGPLCPWTDDRVMGEILSRMNARMMRGDVPLNLTATGLVTHAFLYTGEEKYRQLADETCLKYLPHSSEIAGSVLFFASDLSKPVTGQSLGVNCGHWIAP